MSEALSTAMPVPGTPHQVMSTICEFADCIAWDGAIGIGVPGVVQNNVIRKASHLESSWIGVDLAIGVLAATGVGAIGVGGILVLSAASAPWGGMLGGYLGAGAGEQTTKSRDNHSVSVWTGAVVGRGSNSFSVAMLAAKLDRSAQLVLSRCKRFVERDYFASKGVDFRFRAPVVKQILADAAKVADDSFVSWAPEPIVRTAV